MFFWNLLRSNSFRLLVKVLFIAFIISLIGVAAIYVYLHRHFQPYRNEARKLYSIESLKSNLSSDPLPIEKIPKKLIDAFVIVHEPRFFEYHRHFDWVGFWQAVRSHNSKPHAICLGLANLMIPRTESSTERVHQAIVRQFLAIEIEKHLSKEDVLYFRMNSIRFGSASHGIQLGAQEQFGKPVTELSDNDLISLAIISLNPKYRKAPLPPRLIKETLKRMPRGKSL